MSKKVLEDSPEEIRMHLVCKLKQLIKNFNYLHILLESGFIIETLGIFKIASIEVENYLVKIFIIKNNKQNYIENIQISLKLGGEL